MKMRKQFIFIFLSIISLCSAMEQTSKKISFTGLPLETITKIVTDTISSSNCPIEAGETIRAVSLTTRQLYALVNDSRNTRSFVISFRKKFDLTPVGALLHLQTKEAHQQLEVTRQKLTQEIELITHYAFINCEEFLQNAHTSTPLSNNKNLFTTIVLDCAYNSLGNTRKPIRQHLKASVASDYAQLISRKDIYLNQDLNFVAISPVDMNYVLAKNKALLLYISAMITTFMSDICLKTQILNNSLDTYQKLFSALKNDVCRIFFYDDGSPSTMATIMFKRIKAKSSYDGKLYYFLP